MKLVSPNINRLEIRRGTRKQRQSSRQTFFYQPADIVTQVLNFGLPAPIDIQLVGRDPKNLEIAREIQTRVSAIPGAIDVHLQQVPAVPDLFINVDRTQAQQLGLAQRDVASNVLVSLSSSFQTAPNFWLNPQNGVSYAVQVMTPSTRLIRSIHFKVPRLVPARGRCLSFLATWQQSNVLNRPAW